VKGAIKQSVRTPCHFACSLAVQLIVRLSELKAMRSFSLHLITMTLIGFLSTHALAETLNFAAAKQFAQTACTQYQFTQNDSWEANEDEVRRYATDFFSVLYGEEFPNEQAVGEYHQRFTMDQLMLLNSLAFQSASACAVPQMFDWASRYFDSGKF
jgi:hypothetical protein